MKLATRLLPHQEAAVEKLKKLKVGALYMEQGTGKTRTALSLVKPRLDAGKVDCILWLCPCSVKRNLKEDLAFHCQDAPDEVVVRGIESLSSSDRLYMQLLRLVETHKVFLVVDESNLVKNKKAIRTERIIAISRGCRYKLILNGTPISRNEADLFAQWYVLDWRILGYQSYYSFAANHLEYHTVRMPDGREIVDRGRIKRVLNVDYLAEKIAPYTYQVRKDECLELPGKHYRVSWFAMTARQKRIYADTKLDYLANVQEFRSDTIYRLFTALQHVASGREVTSTPDQRMATAPIFSDPLDNPRLCALLEELEGDEKCIVFCKYQTEIDEILSLVPDAVEFSGRLGQKERQKSRQKFMGDARVLVTNKSCGAYGLNLQFCHRVIFYDNDFDLATRLQAEDRVHRIGQEHDVEVVDICGTDTIDEFIRDCLLRKKNLAEAFKEEVKERKDGKNLLGQDSA